MCNASIFAGQTPFGFFEPGVLALPMGAISFVLIILLGPLVLPDNKGGLFREVREHGDNLVTALDITEDGLDVASSSRFPGCCIVTFTIFTVLHYFYMYLYLQCL